MKRRFLGSAISPPRAEREPLRHGWSGAVRDRPILYAATFGMSEEVADLYEQMMTDVPVEEYDHRDVEKGKA
jgi:hypothetical protein